MYWLSTRRLSGGPGTTSWPGFVLGIGMRCVVVVLASGFIASSAAAFAFRVGQVPNGPAYQCGLCHVSVRGGGARTAFGEDVRASVMGVNVDWAAVCPLDSDGDTFTNGQELGDPACTWMRGDPVEGPPTNPNDSNDFPAGAGGAGGEGGEGGEPDMGGQGGAGGAVIDAGAGGVGGGEADAGAGGVDASATVDASGAGGAPADGGAGATGGEADAAVDPGADMGSDPPADGGDDGCQQGPGSGAPGWLLGLAVLAGGRRGPRRR